MVSKGNANARKLVIGEIKWSSKQLFAFLVLNRAYSTLVEVAKEMILPKTCIMSDQWRSNSRMTMTLNYQNFVDPNDRAVHTQKVERLWRSLKRFKEHGPTNNKEKLLDKICGILIGFKYKLDSNIEFAFYMLYLIPEIDFLLTNDKLL